MQINICSELNNLCFHFHVSYIIFKFANFVFTRFTFKNLVGWMMISPVRSKSVTRLTSHLVRVSFCSWQSVPLLLIDYELPTPNERSDSRVSRHSLHPNENFTHFTHFCDLHFVWMLLVWHVFSPLLIPVKCYQAFILQNIMNSIPHCCIL